MSPNEIRLKRKVLVVDDEHRIADTLTVILNQSGFDASAAYTGTMAVDRAREIRPDLVITDVIMPDMNGIEAAIQIRAMLPACKILLFSGQAATADLLERGGDPGFGLDHLSKQRQPHGHDLAVFGQALHGRIDEPLLVGSG